ncbi:MAG: hypothetical protein QHH06_03230 [Clostridiales bacterium]|nr:hypothetical protein [Eubacteriales bacterium]MDH7565480.1 hypothetical protein [Clostridiales bacterium]
MHTVFECVWKTQNRCERWPASITYMKNYGSHYEFQIMSRSSIRVIIGRSTSGNFACIPDYDAGCHLSDLGDIFWNKERLTKALGKVDGITVAYALKAIADKVDFTGSYLTGG